MAATMTTMHDDDGNEYDDDDNDGDDDDHDLYDEFNDSHAHRGQPGGPQHYRTHIRLPCLQWYLDEFNALLAQQLKPVVPVVDIFQAIFVGYILPEIPTAAARGALGPVVGTKTFSATY